MKKKLFALMMVFVLVLSLGLMTSCGEKKSDKDAETIVVGLDDTFAPMGFRDKD